MRQVLGYLSTERGERSSGRENLLSRSSFPALFDEVLNCTSEPESLRETRGKLKCEGDDGDAVDEVEIEIEVGVGVGVGVRIDPGRRGDLRQVAEEPIIFAKSLVGVVLRDVSKDINETWLKRVGNEPRYLDSRDSISVASSASILYNNCVTPVLII